MAMNVGSKIIDMTKQNTIISLKNTKGLILYQHL